MKSKIKLNINMTEEEEIGVWKDYRKTNHEDYREFFVRKYAPLVKYVAGKVACNVPDSIEFEDLVGFGTFGLLDAIKKYDPTKGTKFKTYGITRIRGQIYDELRTLDWVPRSVRQKHKLIEEIRKKYHEEHNKKITNEEISQKTGISLSEVERISNMANDSTISSLDDVWYLGQEEDEISMKDTIKSPNSVDPYNYVEKEEIRRIIASKIQALPEREKKVLILYYYEDLTLKEIGAVLDVTESRVSQLHTKAIRHVRNYLEDVKQSLV